MAVRATNQGKSIGLINIARLVGFLLHATLLRNRDSPSFILDYKDGKVTQP